ncbi:MAG: PEP-CTERM sorting domain-containing protein [Phycisphaeraceae bacterium]|nr:PEP-CTERM sorting domain-containing protein [Phycisphaeraceae bacterium]
MGEPLDGTARADDMPVHNWDVPFVHSGLAEYETQSRGQFFDSDSWEQADVNGQSVSGPPNHQRGAYFGMGRRDSLVLVDFNDPFPGFHLPGGQYTVGRIEVAGREVRLRLQMRETPPEQPMRLNIGELIVGRVPHGGTPDQDPLLRITTGLAHSVRVNSDIELGVGLRRNGHIRLEGQLEHHPFRQLIIGLDEQGYGTFTVAGENAYANIRMNPSASNTGTRVGLHGDGTMSVIGGARVDHERPLHVAAAGTDTGMGLLEVSGTGFVGGEPTVWNMVGGQDVFIHSRGTLRVSNNARFYAGEAYEIDGITHRTRLEVRSGGQARVESGALMEVAATTVFGGGTLAVGGGHLRITESPLGVGPDGADGSFVSQVPDGYQLGTNGTVEVLDRIQVRENRLLRIGPNGQVIADGWENAGTIQARGMIHARDGGFLNEGTLVSRDEPQTHNVLAVEHQFDAPLVNKGRIDLYRTTIHGPIHNMADGEIVKHTLHPSVFDGPVKGPGRIASASWVRFRDVYEPGYGAAAGVEVELEGLVAFGSASTVRLAIGGTDAGQDHDLIRNIGGSGVQLHLTGELEVLLEGGFEPELGDRFTLAQTSGSLLDVFTRYDLPELGGDLQWLADYDDQSFSLVVIPEPGSIGALLAGAALLIGRRTRAS